MPAQFGLPDAGLLLPQQAPVKIDSPDVVEARRLTLEQARAQRQQTIDQAATRRLAQQDAADLQEAIQTHLGPDGLPDVDAALTALYPKNARAAGTLQKAFQAARKAQGETDKLEDDHAEFLSKSTAQLLQGASEDTWGTVHYPMLQRTNPAVAARMSRDWTPQTEAQIQAYLAHGTPTKEYQDAKAKARESFLKGEDDKALGELLLAEGSDLTPDRATEIIRDTRDRHGVSSTVAASYQNLPDVKAMLARARRAVLGPEKTETIDATKARDALNAENTLADNNRADRAAATQIAQNAAAQKTAQGNLAVAQGHLALAQQKARDDQGLSLGGSIDPNAPHGAEFLKTVGPQAAMVKALAEGKQPWPTAQALKTPYWQGLMQKVFQYDPTFDTAQASNNARVKTRVDFTSGKSAGTINALNTVVGHLGKLATIGDKLDNTGLDFVNSVRNWLTPGGTDRGAAINSFDLAKQAVASELTRVYRQAGGDQADIAAWKATINAAKSPAELRDAWATIGDLIQSKLDALQTQADQGLGIGSLQIMTPEARQHMSRLTGGQSAPAGGTAKAPDGSMQVGKYSVTPIK